MKVTGPSLDQLNRSGDQFAAAVTAQMRGVLRKISYGLSTHVTVDDLAPIHSRWTERVDSVLMRQVVLAYWTAVNEVSRPILTHLAGLTAAGPIQPAQPPGPDPSADDAFADPGLPDDLDAMDVRIARVPGTVAEQYMANARNRLVNVGNLIWEQARGELVDGMTAGEGVSSLADRVANVAADLAGPRAEVIARTEVNGASNAGALDQMRALDVPATKSWLATEDERTRPDHADADGQEVGVDEQFTVGGESMDRPHDESASAAQTVDCRCTVTFSIPDDQVAGLDESGSDGETASAVVAAAEDMTGAMIALVPSAADLDRLALDGGEPIDQLHLTLFYLGEAATYDPPMRQSVIANVDSLFSGFGPVSGMGFGADYWNPQGDSPAWVLAVSDTPDGYLIESHEIAASACDAAGCAMMMPDQHAPWVPHVCLAYSKDLGLLADVLDRVGPITFDTVRVAFAGEVTDVSLTQGESSAVASLQESLRVSSLEAVGGREGLGRQRGRVSREQDRGAGSTGGAVRERTIREK